MSFYFKRSTFLHFKLQQSINQLHFRRLLFPSMSQIAVLKHRSMKCLRQVTEQKQNANITLNASISTRMLGESIKLT
jgi:hypothetical protein